jgi:hypothetical protein
VENEAQGRQNREQTARSAPLGGTFGGRPSRIPTRLGAPGGV